MNQNLNNIVPIGKLGMFKLASDLLSENNSLLFTGPLKFLEKVSPRLDTGTLTIVSATYSDLKDINRGFHWLMIEAFDKNIEIYFVDVSNSFNPHMLSDIKHSIKNRMVDVHGILENIKLARPFQQLQSLGIFRDLISKFILNNIKNKLIIVTSLDMYIKQNENKEEMILQLIQILSGLQNIALMGNIVIISVELTDTLMTFYSSFASIHIIKDKKLVLLKHPYLPNSMI